MPKFLDTSRSKTLSSSIRCCSGDHAHDRSRGRSGYSRNIDDVVSLSGRTTDAQYDMSILKTSRYDVETSSQEAIVSKESR